jgi:hypothetical protein
MASPISNQLDTSSISPSTLHGGNPQAQATGQHHPAITVHIEDGLEVETRIEYAPDGTVVVNVHRHSLAVNENRSHSVPILLV